MRLALEKHGISTEKIQTIQTIVTIVELGAGAMGIVKSITDAKGLFKARAQQALQTVDEQANKLNNLHGREKLGLLQAIEGSKVLQDIPATQELIKTLSPDFQKMLNEIRSTQRYANRTNTEIAIFRRRNGTVSEFALLKRLKAQTFLLLLSRSLWTRSTPPSLRFLKMILLRSPNCWSCLFHS